jgi:hypothetical protein
MIFCSVRFLYFVTVPVSDLLIRQHNGAVNRIRQTTMASSDHHGTDDELAKGAKHAAQRRHHGWITETQPDVATVEDLAYWTLFGIKKIQDRGGKKRKGWNLLCGNNFKEDGPNCESLGQTD